MLFFQFTLNLVFLNQVLSLLQRQHLEVLSVDVDSSSLVAHFVAIDVSLLSYERCLRLGGSLAWAASQPPSIHHDLRTLTFA